MAKATKEVDLAAVLAESLNKQSKDQRVAFFWTLMKHPQM